MFHLPAHLPPYCEVSCDNLKNRLSKPRYVKTDKFCFVSNTPAFIFSNLFEDEFFLEILKKKNYVEDQSPGSRDP